MVWHTSKSFKIVKKFHPRARVVCLVIFPISGSYVLAYHQARHTQDPPAESETCCSRHPVATMSAGMLRSSHQK